MNMPPAPERPKSASFVALVLAGHSALGLTFAALIYVLCFSGTVAVFANELRRWERPDGPLVVAATPAAIGNAVRAGGERARELDASGDIFVQAPNAAWSRLLVQINDDRRGIAEAWLANEQGSLVERHATPWWEFLIGLHYRLHVPGIAGLILVGAIGVFTLSLIISGVLAHPRIFRDAFFLRWGGGRHLQEADLHNRLSVWGLPFHLTIALSGAVLGLSAVTVSFLVGAAHGDDTAQAYTTLYGPGPGDDRRPAALPDIRAIIDVVLEKYPDAAIETIVVQQAATAGQLVHVTTSRPGQLNVAERHFFDGSGQWLRTAGYDDGPAGLQWTAAMTTLHYGSFGGWMTKLAYVVLGVAMTIVTANGVTIWLARWSDKGRPRVGWQRIWSAVVWGQAAAFAVSALVAMKGDVGSVGLAYGSVVVVTLVWACLAKEALRLSRVLRLISAALLLALAVAHVIVWRSTMTDSIGWVVNAIIAAVAVTMAGSAVNLRAAASPARPSPGVR